MKKLSLLATLLCACMMTFAAESVVYTLTYANVTGGGNVYASTYDITVDGINWNVPGNTTTDPVRIGGKNLTDADRALYSKTAIPGNITKVVVSHGTKTLTVNSVKLSVYATAEDAAAGTNAISTIDGGEFVASSDMTFARPNNADWTGRFYRLVYNVTAGSSNQYVQFIKADFYVEVADVAATGIELNKTALTLEQYREEALVATLTPADANTPVVWESGNTELVTVSDKGVVTALAAEGTAIVTATAGEGIKATCTVTLAAAQVLTVADAAAKAASVATNNALYEGGKYVVRGYVTELLTNASFTKENEFISFWMDDAEGTTKTLEVYKANWGAEVEVGDFVEVIGYLTKYNTTNEVAAGCTYSILPKPAALEPATYYGAEGFLTEGAVIAPAQWTACEYNITRNADKTLTFVAEFTNDVTGLVGQINLGDGFKDMAKDGLKFTYSTTATYEDGAALEGAFFYFPYAGAAKRIDITYTVGATNEKPATPVDARLKGAYKIGGDAADYAKLSDAIAAIEANGMSGDVDLLICADLAENVNIGVTNNSEYTLTIRPDKAEKRTITYGDQADNDGPSGHILVGALMAKDFNTTLATKNVWFDGSVDGEGQYLEIRAGAVGGRTVVFYGDVTNSGIKNCRIINPRATGTNYAVEIRTEKNSDKRPVGIVIENNYIEDKGSANTQAIQFNGSQSATADGKPKDVVIRNNEIVANLRGIFFNGAENAVIEGNTFRLAKASAGFLAHGIMGNAQKGTIIVRGNKFLELGTMNASAGEFGICGITASGNADVWVIENNVFAGLDAKADVAGKIITLRYVRCGDSCVVRNNTFHLPAQTYKPATDLVAAQAVTCLWLAGTKLYVAENNLLVSEETEVNNSLIRGALNENVKNNVFFHKGGNAAVLAGAVVAKTWEEFAALEGTAGSKWTEPKFVDAANGDFAIAEYNEGLLIPRLESVLTDIEGTDRAEQTCAGAFEFVGEPVVDDTYFEYTVTETIAKNTETEATGGTIIFGADKFETMNGTDLFGYKLDGDPSETNTKYVLCKLNRPLAENDVISITGFASSNPKDGQAFQVSLDRAGAKVVGTAATTVAKAIETLDIPVKADAAGATEFYITRVSASVYFTAVKVHADDGTAIGISSIDAADAARKVMINGELFIIKGDAMYTITGARVK